METNHDILHFLWRWKLVSASALSAKFFPGVTDSGANKRLFNLERKRIIHAYRFHDREAKVLFGLSARGFKVLKDDLPELVEVGFRSEHPFHDFLVTAIHLGEWLVSTPPQCDLFSEQELRRCHVDNYPDWVPKTTIHRPDGYWRVSLPEGQGTVALEVEMTLKTPHWYGVVAKFYRDQPKIFRVVWLVQSASQASSIRDRLQKGSPENIGIHHFVVKEDFLSLGWQALLRFGSEAGKSVAFLLGNRSGKTTEKYSVFSLLETRKFPRVSSSYSSFSKSSFSLLGRSTHLSTQNNNSTSDQHPAPVSNYLSVSVTKQSKGDK